MVLDTFPMHMMILLESGYPKSPLDAQPSSQDLPASNQKLGGLKLVCTINYTYR